MGHPVAFDHAYFVVIAIVSPVLDAFWLYPRLKRKTAAGEPRARERFYLYGIATQWGLVMCVLVAWRMFDRKWDELWLGLHSPLRLACGLIVAGILLALLWMQRKAVIDRHDRLELVRRQLQSAIPLLPHTAAEHRLFRGLSLTAGICEEILFRGFVIWYVGAWTGLFAAAAISSIVFGFAHAYLGGPHVLRTALGGGLLAIVVLGSGSLWPAMIVHAAVDLNSGDLSFLALTTGGDKDKASPRPERPA